MEYDIFYFSCPQAYFYFLIVSFSPRLHLQLNILECKSFQYILFKDNFMSYFSYVCKFNLIL
jgi:hypothetical protein